MIMTHTSGVCVCPLTVDKPLPKQKTLSAKRYANFERYAEGHATLLQSEDNT